VPPEARAAGTSGTCVVPPEARAATAPEARAATAPEARAAVAAGTGVALPEARAAVTSVWAGRLGLVVTERDFVVPPRAPGRRERRNRAGKERQHCAKT